MGQSQLQLPPAEKLLDNTLKIQFLIHGHLRMKGEISGIFEKNPTCKTVGNSFFSVFAVPGCHGMGTVMYHTNTLVLLY